MGLRRPSELTDKAAAHVAEYVPLHAGEALLLVYDGTTFGSAKTGFAITDRRVAHYDKHDLESIAYADIAAIHIADDHTNVEHVVHVTPRTGAPLEVTLYLAPRQFARLLEPIRERLAPDIAITRGGTIADGAKRYAAAGRPIRCAHCSGEDFRADVIMMNTRGAELLGISWMNGDATRLECATCSCLLLFAQPPVVRTT